MRYPTTPPSRSTEKSWPHFRPSAVDFCCSRLAIGAATERARALAMPAVTRAQALQTRANSSGVAPASTQAAYRALLEKGLAAARRLIVAASIYLESLPIFTRGLVRLPNHARLIRELCLLERRTQRSGKDTVEHPR